jgi:hypothetical protein
MLIIRSKKLIPLLLTIMLISLGCSSPDRTSVIVPDSPESQIQSGAIPVGVSDWSRDGTPESGYGVMGLFNLGIDAKNLNAELTLLRQSSLTDVLEVVDITNFLKLAPCQDCADISSISLDTDGNIVVSIGIKHPFDIGDPHSPIYCPNRFDLHVFNVEGTIVSNNTVVTYPSLGVSLADVPLVNADGYSAYLDDSLDSIYPTDATVHPYVLHFDDYTEGNFSAENPYGFLSVTDPPPSGNLVMAMGCDYNYKDYIFNLEAGDSVNYIFAVGCTYAVSAAKRSDRLTPEYRIPQHNKKAASEVRVSVIANDLRDDDANSSAEIEVSVVDVSQGVAVGENLDEMFAESNVDDIFIDIPGILSSLSVIDGNNPVSGTGHDPSDPLIYHKTINNELLAGEGTYRGLVKVLDSYTPGLNTSPLLNGMDGIERVDPIANPLSGLFAISDFATYATFRVSIGVGNDPPVAVLAPDQSDIEMGEMVNFDGTGSYDTDGTITLYEFDFDWDGIEANFVADTSNTTGVATSFPYPDSGMYTAGLRVTDDSSAVDYDSATVNVAELDVIYVDDSNTSGVEDGTMAHPFNTIPEGLNAAPTGYQVWVDDSGADYMGPITTKANVLLRSVNWNASDGGNMAAILSNGGSVVSVVADSTIDGFKAHGPSCTTGMYLSNADNAVVKNCWITDVGLNPVSSIVEGMRISYGNGMTIDNCEFSNVQLNTSSGILDGIYNMGPTNVTIKRCKFHNFTRNTDSGLLLPVYFNDVTGIEFHNNLIYDMNSYVNGINIGVYWNTSINSNVTNNVIVDIGDSAISGGISIDNESSGFVGKNNIIGSINGNGISCGSPDIIWNYNCLFETAYGTHPAGTGNITADPMFVDEFDDVHLQTGSPCIDTGDPNIYDIDGSRSDMGRWGGPGGN